MNYYLTKIVKDSYAVNYPKDELSIEAQFKAANLAKNIESPENVATRFRSIATEHPKHNLAKSALKESIAVLVKAKKWESLQLESHDVEKSNSLQDLVATDGELKNKITEAKELSQVMIAEDLEKQEKFAEMKAHLEKVEAENPSEKMGIFVNVKLATLSEKHLQDHRAAIAQYDKLRAKYALSAEARSALIEQARLYEQVNEPRKTVEKYLEFARLGTGKTENQALTNAAVILSDLGEREPSADIFFQLQKRLENNTSTNKDSIAALEAGCNNLLLASFQHKDKALLERIGSCARQLGTTAHQPLVWQARAAWAMDQMADSLQADSTWKKIAAKSIKATPESERAYIVAGKIHVLKAELEEFKALKFTKNNERPEANLAKKTAAMERLEHNVEVILKTGTSKQAVSAKNTLKSAYQDFADTLEQANTPSKLSDEEKAELKKSFLSFAQEFQKKAQALEPAKPKDGEPDGRAIASTSTAADETNAPQVKEVKDSSLTNVIAQQKPGKPDNTKLSTEEEALLSAGKEPPQNAAVLYAKKAFQFFRDGKYGDAHYFAEKWKKNLNAALPEFNQDAYEKFHQSLTEKLPETDPLNDEI